MNHSYVMGTDNSILELKKQGFIIENDGDNFMVSFEKESLFLLFVNGLFSLNV